MEERSEAEVVKEEEKAEKAKEPEKASERKVTAKEVVIALAEKVSELEQRLSQQQQLIEAMRSTFLQYQQVLDQISEAVKAFQQANPSGGGEVGSGLLMWLLRSFLSSEGGGSDKLMRMFLTETLKTNIALQRILLHGIARGLGVSLKQVVRKSKEEEEEEEEEEEGKR
ncbi:MAG: hypothetical protein QW461_10780 [Candidatus Jordarchaeales archaeon]